MKIVKTEKEVCNLSDKEMLKSVLIRSLDYFELNDRYADGVDNGEDSDELRNMVDESWKKLIDILKEINKRVYPVKGDESERISMFG